MNGTCAGDNCGERGGAGEVLGAHARHVPHAADPREGAAGRDGPGLNTNKQRDKQIDKQTSKQENK